MIQSLTFSFLKVPSRFSLCSYIVTRLYVLTGSNTLFKDKPFEHIYFFINYIFIYFFSINYARHAPANCTTHTTGHHTPRMHATNNKIKKFFKKGVEAMANKKAQWAQSKLLMSLGGLMSVSAYIANLTAWISPPTFILSLISGIASFAYGAFKTRDEKIEKFFEAAGLKIDDNIPTILDRHEYENGFSLILKMPAGLCLTDFEKKKEALEQFFNANVDLKFDKNLIITVNNNGLKKRYDFELFNFNEPLKFAIGYSKHGLYSIDMEEAIHVLIAGATGAGKSVLLRAIITGLILTKTTDDICMHLVDFMRVELGIFRRSYMVNDFSYIPEQFEQLLDQLAEESERRLKMFETQNIVNIRTWNKRNKDDRLKYHIVIVDEFAALSDRRYKHILDKLKLRVAQDRKCGIHYILCTQRPSRDIIDGTIKANLPSRLCMKTASDSDSEIVLDVTGAEKLRGAGHALSKIGIGTTEIQTMFIDEEEAQRLIKHTYIEKQTAQSDDTSGVIVRA